MKKVGYYSAVVVALLLGAGWALQAELHQSRARAQQVSWLPPLIARSLDGTRLVLPAHATSPVVLIYFEPDCDHCQRQATEVRRHSAGFETAQVFWLSTDSLSTLRHFAQQYALLEQPGMRVVQIRREMARSLSFFSVPDIRIYDGHNKLVHRYKGETSAAVIINSL